MALLFLHYSPNVELIGITTGYGNASIENTTRNTLYIKERFSIPAPVYIGASGPMVAEDVEYPDFVHGQNGLGDVEFDDPKIIAEEKPAFEAIIDAVREDPGEVSIVAVGRQTNLARAIEQAPEIPRLIKEIVIMGGAFGFNGHSGNITSVAEANIWGDPVAADHVIGCGAPLTIVGLDVTEEIVVDEGFFDELKRNSGDAGELIASISPYYLAFHEKQHGKLECPVHDSSAVACLLRPDLFSTKEDAVRVVTGGISRGQTLRGPASAQYRSTGWDDRQPCRICTDVDAGSVLELYLGTLRRASN